MNKRDLNATAKTTAMEYVEATREFKETTDTAMRQLLSTCLEMSGISIIDIDMGDTEEYNAVRKITDTSLKMVKSFFDQQEAQAYSIKKLVDLNYEMREENAMLHNEISELRELVKELKEEIEEESEETK